MYKKRKNMKSQRYNRMLAKRWSDWFDETNSNVASQSRSISTGENLNNSSTENSDNDINDINQYSFSDLASNSSKSNISSPDMNRDINLEDKCSSDVSAEDIAEWAIKYNVPHITLTSLLKLLKRHKCFSKLPCQARTLLRTPRLTQVKSVPPGNYIHFNLREQILKLLPRNISIDCVELKINFDGLPISKSSKHSLWPILGNIKGYSTVFIIGIYYGEEKPNDPNKYIEDFVQEAKFLTSNGIEHEGKILNFKLNAIICDAPAKSFILCIKGHNGYSSCSKCTTEGTYHKNRICFPDTNAQLRKDIDFTMRTDEEFHKEDMKSLLDEIPNLGLVTNVPLDYMHLVCLGVVRKLILLWVKGNLNKGRISYTKINEISEKLISLKPYIPSEFSRKPRSLDDIKYWKATEFRQFLLYTGPVVLRDTLPTEQYSNFLKLHASIRILCEERCNDADLELVKTWLISFIYSFQNIYGMEHISHNIHGLIHLPEDVKLHGSLDSFSAFKFENFMSKIKSMLRKSHKPLEQIARRLTEVSEYEKNKNSEEWQDLGNHCMESNFSISKDLKSIKNNKYYFKANSLKDSCCGINSDIIVIKEFIYDTVEERYVLKGQRFRERNNYFKIPQYSKLNISKVSRLSNICTWPIQEITEKYVLLRQSNEFIAIPLIHQ